jgi:hypothetical protein
MAGILKGDDAPPKKVVIKYIVEADGVPVYTECLDVDDVAAELASEEDATIKGWIRRLRCTICCSKRRGTGACLIRCLVDGKCCDNGHEGCRDA